MSHDPRYDGGLIVLPWLGQFGPRRPKVFVMSSSEASKIHRQGSESEEAQMVLLRALR